VSISLTPANSSKALGLTQQFTATGTYTDATTQDISSSVTWSSSSTATATISNAAGTKGLATTVATGSTTITATHAGSGVSASTSFTVSAAELVSLAITPANSSKALGLTQQFTATGTYTNGTTQDLTTTVTWSSSSIATATISNAAGTKGLATTVATGSTTITATHSGSGVSANNSFTVSAAELVSLAITPANPTLILGSTQQFTATGTYTDGTNLDVSSSVAWSSSSTGVATISNAGGSQGLATTVATGTTTITATHSSSGVTNSTSCTVALPPSNPPTAPQNVQAFAANGRLSVSWDPPASTGGAAITSYTVTLSPGGAQQTTTNVDAAARPAVGTITTRTTNPTGGTGDWSTNNYGQYGHILAAYDNTTSDRAALPAGVSYTTSGSNRVQWATNTTDTSHLADPARSTRTLSAWWSGSTMTQTLRFAEPAARTLRIYVHAGGATRNQTVSVTVGATTQTQIISNLTGVLWLDVPINVPAGGTATITTTSVVNNAVINGLFLDPPATNTCSITTGLTPGTPYTASVTATNSAGTGPSAISTGGWSPASVSPALWLDANDAATITSASNKISAWADKSGNAYNATQATTANQPTLSGTSVQTSATTYLTGSIPAQRFPSSLQSTTVFKKTGSPNGYEAAPFNRTNANYPAPIDRYNSVLLSGSGPVTSLNLRDATSRGVLSSTVSPTAVNEFYNGTQQYSGTGTYSYGDTATTYGIGTRQDLVTHLTGDINEIVVTNALSTADRQSLEGYLAWKWGTQASLPLGHPYNTAPPGPAPTTLAAAPTGLTPTAGNTQVSLSWTPPTNTGGSPIRRYYVTTYSNAALTTQIGTPVWTTADGVTTATVTGLTNATQFWFTVTPVTTAGLGTPSTFATATPIGPPAEPTGPLASRSTVTNFTTGLSYPYQMAFNASGDLFVAEYGGHRIRRITPAGVVTTFAGSGTASSIDATGTAASFNGPTGLAFDASGDLFVAEYGGHRIRRITPAGVVTTFAGSGSPGGADGTGTAASFNQPIALAFNAAGDLFVADSGSHRIRRITPAGVVTTFAGSGSPGGTDGTGTAASFNRPHDLTFNASGDLFVADQSGHRIRRITPAAVVTTFAGSGSPGGADGTGTAASFNRPSGITTDAADNLYVTDYTGHRIRKITLTGVVTTTAGNGTAGTATGPATGPVTNGPGGIERDTAGIIHIAQFDGHRITRLTPAGTGALAVAWTAPANTGGAPITDYLVEYRTSPSGPWTVFSDGVSTTTSTTITGLTNGTAYDVRISAINAIGTGNASTAVTATPGVAPGAPTGLIVTPASGQLTATWTAPADNGGAAVSDYAVEYRTSPSGTWTVFPDGVSSATTATITGLASATTYEVRIRAANSFDCGSPSSTASATTP
jgi:hypothetical protein